MTEYCICGHAKEKHSFLCEVCYDKHLSMPHLTTDDWENSRKNVFHSFKLDNLKYIEDLAKQKNLI